MATTRSRGARRGRLKRPDGTDVESSYPAFRPDALRADGRINADPDADWVMDR